MATSAAIPNWYTDQGYNSGAYQKDKYGNLVMPEDNHGFPAAAGPAASTPKYNTSPSVASLNHFAAPSASAGVAGVSASHGISKPAASAPAPSVAPMGGGAEAPAPVAMPDLAQEAPPSTPPSLQALNSLSMGGGSSPTPPGQIEAPGSLRTGIGAGMPPSLAALLKPRVY